MDSQEIEAETLRKINRAKWEECIKALEARGGKLELTQGAVEQTGPISLPFTFEPTTYTQNKVESNAKAHVGSAIHLAVDSNDVAAVFGLNEFFETVKHSNKRARDEKTATGKRLHEAKKESEYQCSLVALVFRLLLRLVKALDGRGLLVPRSVVAVLDCLEELVSKIYGTQTVSGHTPQYICQQGKMRAGFGVSVTGICT
jgi:hypothetical protein